MMMILLLKMKPNQSKYHDINTYKIKLTSAQKDLDHRTQIYTMKKGKLTINLSKRQIVDYPLCAKQV